MKNFEDLDIGDYFRIARRRIWYVILPAVIVTGSVAAYVWKLPSVYKSESTIQVSSRLVPEDYIGSIVRESVADQIEFVKQQLKSRTFLEQIVREFQLYGKRPDRIEDAIDLAAIRTEIVVSPPNLFKLGYSTTDPHVAQAVVKGLAAKVMELNHTFRKQKAYVADQFLDEQLRQAADELSQAEQKLGEFMQQQFQGVSEQGITFDRVNQFETELAALRADLERTVADRDSMQHRIEEQQQLKTVMSAPAAVPHLPTAPGPEPASRPLSDPEQKLASKRAELQTLLAKYTPLHPDVARLNRELRELESQVAQSGRLETATTVKAAKTEPASRLAEKQVLPDLQPPEVLFRAEMEIEVNRLDREIADKEQLVKSRSNKLSMYRARLSPTPAVAQELAELTREQEAAKQRHTLLWNKKINSEMATSVDSSEENVTFNVVDPANLPQYALSPNRRLLAAAGGLAGIVLGLGLAFVRENMDSSLHDEDELSVQLGLPVLAAIPTITLPKRTAWGRDAPLLIASPTHAERDAATLYRAFNLQSSDAKVRSVISDSMTVAGSQFRLISANLSVLRKQRSVRTLLMISAVPNEGKTFAACCLAAILAQESGGKVLLIDADMRTGNSSKTLGVNQRPTGGGLRAILQGQADIDQSIMKCVNSNLYFLPSGSSLGHPAELLNSSDLERVFSHTSSRFDWVIVDSPPIMLADALYLVPHCDMALMVVRAEQTPLKIIDKSIQRIGRARILGVLLNDVRPVKATRYYQHYEDITAAAGRNGHSKN